MFHRFQLFFREHPVGSVVGTLVTFVLFTLPVWLSEVWSLWSDEPFFKVVAGTRWEFLVAGPLYGWLCVVIGLLLVIFAGVTTFQSRSHARPAVTDAGVPRRATKAFLATEWVNGAQPVIEVQNKSDGPVECLATGKILHAEWQHKRRDTFPASWREHYESGRWVKLAEGERKKITIATRTHAAGDWWVAVPEQDGQAESWRGSKFRFADVWIELETRPPLQERKGEWYRVTWNDAEQVFELGRPLESESDD